MLGLGLATAALAFAAIAASTGFAGNSSSAAEYQYGGKITVCHHTHSKKHPTVTIRISANAWKAHRRHGDTQGACGTATNSSPSAKQSKATREQHGKANGKANGKAHRK